MNTAPSPRRPPIAALWLLPVACHAAFSWIGFNPTDEGWLQAIARRLLDGQVPHRDFISLRPVLSAALQMPLTAWGGDYVFWLARLWGWLELGALAWLWSAFLAPSRPAVRAVLFPAILFLNAHTFPVMAWHTLDGLVFCSAAVALALRATTAAWCGAFLLTGLAILARQNFVFFLPFLALGLPHVRLWPAVLCAGIAPALYAGYLFSADALHDFYRQITASRGLLLDAALRHPLQQSALWLGVAAGLAAAFGLHRSRSLRPRAGAIADAVFVGLSGLLIATCLWSGSHAFHHGAFALLGLAVALTGATLLARRLDPTTRLWAVCSLGLAWAALISSGYNQPSLTAGVLLVVVWQLAAHLAQRPSFTHRIPSITVGAVVAVLAIALWHARREYPYMEKPARELTYDAGPVLRGASGLRTQLLTHDALLELQSLTDAFEQQGRPYAILTDYSAHWVRSTQRNPLVCEWPQSTELARNPDLYQRVAAGLGRLPPTTVLIVQRHITGLHYLGLVPLSVSPEFYTLQDLVASHSRLLSSGHFFQLYALPSSP